MANRMDSAMYSSRKTKRPGTKCNWMESAHPRASCTRSKKCIRNMTDGRQASSYSTNIEAKDRISASKRTNCCLQSTRPRLPTAPWRLFCPRSSHLRHRRLLQQTLALVLADYPGSAHLSAHSFMPLRKRKSARYEGPVIFGGIVAFSIR